MNQFLFEAKQFCFIIFIFKVFIFEAGASVLILQSAEGYLPNPMTQGPFKNQE